MPQVLILSAGFGTRLRPISTYLPKPLFPVLTIPILKRHLLFFKKFHIKRVLINLHYLGDLIESEIKKWDTEGLEVILLKEEVILGTGGGVRNALEYIDKSMPLLVHNCDILCVFDLAKLIKWHLDNKNHVTLLTHHHPTIKNLKAVDDVVISFNSNDEDSLLYTGICVLSSDFISTILPGRNYCLVDAFKDFLNGGGKIHHLSLSQIQKNPIWFDIGTFESLYRLHELLMRVNHVAIISKTRVHDKVHVEGWACIGENVTFGNNSYIKDSILFDGAIVHENETITNSIVYGDIRIRCN